jgi:hypothetical protein
MYNMYRNTLKKSICLPAFDPQNHDRNLFKIVTGSLHIHNPQKRIPSWNFKISITFLPKARKSGGPILL